MKTYLLNLIILISFGLQSQTLNIKNSNVFGGSDSDSIVKIIADNQNNTYSVGHFYGELDLNQDILINNNYQSVGLSDLFIKKTDENGNFIWGKTFGTDSIDRITNLNYFDNKLFITGQFSKTIKLDNIELKSIGKLDAFIAVMDLSGKILWAKSYGGNSNDIFTSLSINESGICVSGLFTGDVFNQTTNGSLIIAKIKLDGSQTIWSKSLSDNYKIRPNGSAFDSKGNLIFAGSFAGEKIDFNPSLNKDSLLTSERKPNTTFYTQDAFLLKLNPDGEFIFVKKIGGTTGDDIIFDIYANKENLGITGQISGSVVFGSGANTKTIVSNGKEDIFVSLYTDLGELKWIRNAGGTKTDFGKSIYLDSSNNVFITGTFFDTDGKGVDFDPSTRTYKLSSSISQNAFIWNLNSNGDFIDAYSIGGYGVDNGVSIYKQNKNVYASGNFESSFSFGNKTHTSNGKSDIFEINLDLFCTELSLIKPNKTEICSYEFTNLSSNYPTNSLFSWYRDGILISNNSTLDNINTTGNYYLSVDYSGCKSTSLPIFIKVNEKPKASISYIGQANFCKGDSILLIAKGGNKYIWNDLIENDSIYIKQSGSYNVKVLDLNNCFDNSNLYVNTTLPLSEEICLVTCTNNMNKIIWNNTDNLNKKSYKIYKQSKLNSQYEAVFEQPASILSQWIDSNSTNQLERYKISVIDSCGNESELSKNHTTIALSSNLGVNGTVNLAWNAYEGFIYDNFEIWRSEDGTNFMKISSVANNTFIYIDNNPLKNSYYQIRINKNEECLPKKRGINYVESNIISKEGKSLKINDLKLDLPTIYPNPSQGVLTIDNLEHLINESIIIQDLTGRIVYETKIINSKQNFDLIGISTGSYLVISNKQFLGKLIIQ
jgi:hypothetical protein